jgi:hypothetical protein
MNLPDQRRVIEGRTWAQSWDPASMDPIQCYPCQSSRLVDIAYGVACIAASVLVGWLLAQGV